MAEFELLEERIISGKGVLKVPTEALSYRYYTMFVDVYRRPRNEYLNLQWNPAKSMYALMVFRRDGYAQFDGKVEYTRQQFTYQNDVSGQTLIAVRCAYEGILQSFVNLVTGLGGTPGGVGIFVTGVENKIEDFKNVSLGWDEVLFSCYSSSVLQVRFYGADYDLCNTEDIPSFYPPPPPPPRDELPIDAPVTDISPAYDFEDDGGNTIPYEGDEFPSFEFPLGETCELYTITLRVFDSNLDADIEEVYTLFAPIGEPFLFADPGQYGIRIECRGVIQGGVCIEPQTLTFLNSSGDFYSDLRVISVVPYTP